MGSRFDVRRALGCLLAASLGFAGLPLAESWAAPGDPTAPAGEGATAAILPLTVEGDLPDVDRGNLAAQLVEGLERGAFDIIDPGAVESASPGAAKCGTADCYKKIAGAVGATHVVKTRVVVVDRDYELEVILADGKTGKVVARTNDSCEICGVVDVGTMLGTAAATLKSKLDALAKGPSTLSVVSEPIGSEIRIDGELVGTTPFEGPVIPGKSVLRVSKEGYITIEREVTFVEGVAETLTFELEKVPSRLPPRPWGWVSLGFGIAALGTAVGFAAIDERPIRVGGECWQGTDEQGRCAKLWRGEIIGLAAGASGAALITLGVAILINSSTRKRAAREEAPAPAGSTAKLRRRNRRPQVGVGPGSVTLRGRF